jgi:hypothetical protein
VGLENPGKKLLDPLSFLSFRVLGVDISKEKLVRVPFPISINEEALFQGRPLSPGIQFKIDIHNTKEESFDASGFEVGLEIPSGLAVEMVEFATISLDVGRALVILRHLGKFLPDSWQSISLSFRRHHLQAYNGQPIPMALRLYTEMGHLKLEFQVLFEH